MREGKTWLRHLESAQSGLIDIMLLEGRYSVQEIAEEINVRFGYKPIEVRKKRVEDHLAHLAEGGNDRGTWQGMEPHRLRLKSVDEKWMFDV
jgi:hypothetical protein